MSSNASDFPDFIQSRDVAGLKVFLTNEFHYIGNTHRERNNEALFDACDDGSEEICEVLISFGADVNYVIDQRTPLYRACYNAHSSCVVLVMAHGADTNSCNFVDGRTPLMATADVDNTPVGLTLDQFIDNRCRCLHSLLDAGAAIDQTDYEGWTALMYATWNFRLTEILVKAGADVNILNQNRNSCLHFACEGNYSNIAVMLVEHGADNDAVNEDGGTPLHYACSYLNSAVVESLLHHCADIDIVTNNGYTALQVALYEPASPNRVAVLQLMATCAQTRLEESSADWIRMARNERSRPQIPIGSTGISRQRRRRNI